MIYELINYLAATPTPTTSPVYLAVNTPAVLATMGTGVSEIKVYQNRVQNPVAPYIRLVETAQVGAGPAIVGGSYISQPVMLVECASVGKDATGYEARKRAATLRLVVEQVITNAKYTSHGLLTLLDPNGTAARDQIDDWDVDPARLDPVLSGPGDDPQHPVWMAVATSRVTLIQSGVRGYF